MEAKFTVLPYKKNIPRFPKDGNTPAEPPLELPTEETTQLDNDLGLKVSRLVTRYFDANPKDRPPAQKGILDICDSNYPQNYHFLTEFINTQLEVAKQRADPDIERIKGYERLLESLTKEYEPPSNFRVRFRFQEHYVPQPSSFQRMKEEIKDEMRQVFVKGERNIYFGEDAAGGHTGGDFKKAFRKTGSYAKALVYSYLKKTLGREPSQEELRQQVDERRRNLLASGGMDNVYGILEEDAVDELIAEGYGIDVEHEAGSKDFYEKIAGKMDTFPSYKETMSKRARLSRQRDRVMAKQIREIEEETTSSNKKTNLFALLGTYHSPIVDLLPKRLQAVSKSTVSHFILTTPAMHELFRNIMAGENPPDEVWGKAFAEDRRLRLRDR